jgi:hypothetical protein
LQPLLTQAVEGERAARSAHAEAASGFDLAIRDLIALERAAVALGARLRAGGAGWYRREIDARLLRFDSLRLVRQHEIENARSRLGEARAELEIAVRRRMQLERHRARRLERHRLEVEIDEEAELEEGAAERGRSDAERKVASL